MIDPAQRIETLERALRNRKMQIRQLVRVVEELQTQVYHLQLEAQMNPIRWATHQWRMRRPRKRSRL